MAEPLNATFYTLRRRDRAVLLPATVVLIVLLGLIVAAFIAVNWDALASFIAFFKSAAVGGTMTKEAPMAFLGAMFMLFGTGILFSFPAYLAVASYEAACLRWMVRGEAPGLFGLTIDNDTWRVYGVYWCWFIAQIAISWVASLITMPFLFASMGEIIKTPPTDVEAMWRWQLSVQVPLILVQYLSVAFVGIRFGPAAAASVARQRFSVFEAWKVTRGRFGALLGSYALLWLLGFVVIVVACVPVALLTWPHMPPLNRVATTEEIQSYLAAAFSPQALLLMGLGYAALAVWGIGYALMSFGINARAVLVALEEGKIERDPTTA